MERAAEAFAEDLVGRGAGKRLTKDLPLQFNNDDTALLSGARDTIAKRLKGQTAPQRILDCLNAAGTVPFEEGLKFERQAFEACMADPQSSALRYQFFAERAAAKIEGIAEGTEAESVKRVGIIGAGTMGGGIAMCFAQAGFQVTLVDQDQAGLDVAWALSAKTMTSACSAAAYRQIRFLLLFTSKRPLIGVLEGSGSHH